MKREPASAKKLIETARLWIGTKEYDSDHQRILDLYNAHKPLARNYKVKISDHWCATFVSTMSIIAGTVNATGTECSCERFIEVFKKKGIWNEDGTITPKCGDIILFNWDTNKQGNDGWADHIGIVESVAGNTIVCIEGNYNDGVGRRTINVGWGYIRGYASPKYDITVDYKPIKKDIQVVVREVIQGVWGTGDARRKALSEAGYNPDEIQAQVNYFVKCNVRKDRETVAKEVIEGKWGNGADRVKALKAAKYDPEDIQMLVNRMTKK